MSLSATLSDLVGTFVIGMVFGALVVVGWYDRRIEP